jgi:hypothetical protein
VEKVKARAAATVVAMSAVREEIAARILVPDPNVRRTREERDASRFAMEDVEVLNSGNWLAGFTDPRLGAFLGGPGIRALERLVARCDEVMAAELARRATVWPAKFAYCGEPGRAEMDGRLLRVGDVVTLTEAQADAWADRFSRVTEDETVTS